MTVFRQGSTVKASLFSDDGITAKANPIASDANGRFDFYVANGRYDLAFSGPGVNSFTQLNVEITDAMDLTVLGQTPLVFTAANTHSGFESFATGSLGLPSGAANPAICAVGMVFYNTTSGSLQTCTSPNTWSGLGGLTGTGIPIGSINALQKNAGGGNFAASTLTDDGTNIALSINARFKGPNPYVDITAFGARTCNPIAVPCATGLTASINNGLTSATVSSASFLDGDGVIIYGAGAPHSMTTPTVASVTPSVALAGTGALHTTPGPTGATTYNYKMLARDRNGGLTAASAVASTTTGAASLGSQNVSITSMTRSGRTVTVLTAAAHGFLVGCSGINTCGEVFIGAGGTDNTFRGWYTVTSAVDSTHFTFVSGPDTTLGASTSSTGGTAGWFNSNTVCASSLPTGAVELYLLSDRVTPGTYAVVAAGYPNSATGVADICIEDYGSPMMDNQAFPPFITAAAPWASATSDHLSTTVSSGGGTTTLTLANAAGTTVVNATIRLDAVPGIQAAVTQARATGGTVVFPVDSSNNPFVVNSWLNVGSSSVVPFAQMGSLYLNDTFEIPAPGGGGIKYFGDVMPQAPVSANAGVWGVYSHITVNTAHPGFFFSNPSQFGLQVGKLDFSTVPNNGSVLMVAEGGFNQTFDHLNLTSGSGTQDFMSMGIMLKNGPSQANSNVVLDFMTLVPGGGGDGVSATPTFWCRACGTVSVPRSYSLHRGMQFEGTSLSLGDGGVTYINGGGTPLVTAFNQFANIHLNGTIVLDTFAHPCVTVLTTGTNLATVDFELPTTTGTTCQPSSGVLGVSGNYSGLLGFSDQTFANSIGPSILNAGAGVAQISQFVNAYLNVDQNHSAFIRAPQMAAPTCSVSAGGSVTVFTYTFRVAPIWNGAAGYDPPSPSSAGCTTTTGNQTVTINWTTAPGNPVGYAVFTNGGLFRQTSGVGSSCGGSSLLPPGTTSWVVSTPFVNCGVLPATLQTSGPTALLPGAQGIAAPNVITAQLSVSATLFANIGTPANGTMLYCSDCAIANPCAGGGTGALAKRLNGVWVCN